MSINLNSTKEEKEQALERQIRTNKQFKRTKALYYGIIAFVVILVIFAILELTGITSLSWFSRVNKLL